MQIAAHASGGLASFPSACSNLRPAMTKLEPRLHPETICGPCRALQLILPPARWRSQFSFQLLSSAPRDGGFPSGFDYARSGNPNRAALEKGLAMLEGGGQAAAFASGVAAASACDLQRFRLTTT